MLTILLFGAIRLHQELVKWSYHASAKTKIAIYNPPRVIGMKKGLNPQIS